ncbi:MAG: septum site-determining protein minD, partial [Actinomycetota bacterium]|nr:septum site-determining protein minD [Actinomycetota bacterium]
MRRQTAPPLPPPASVLVVSNNQRLVDELRRLAAITGCVPLVVGEALAVRPAWATAPVVLVGDDMAGALSDLRLP